VTLEYAFVHPDESLAAMGINSQVLVKVATREAQPLPHELREAILRQEGHSPG
jgi:acyl-CoA thioesterase FadM